MAASKSSNTRKALSGWTTSPIEIKGPASERIGAADHAAYQCHILLARALEEMQCLSVESGATVLLRALLGRARELAVAGNELLSLEEFDEGKCEQLEKVVFHG